MTMHSIVTLSNTYATRITPEGIHSGMDLTIQNGHPTGNIYVGAEGVTTENYGFRIYPETAWSVELPGKDAIYAISDIEGLQASILKLGLEIGN